jgi:arylsulfatase A-like enzyme
MPSRLPKGKVYDAPVGGVDLIPTFFSFAEIDLPWDMHGRDLRPELENPNSQTKHSLLTIHTGRFYGSDTDSVPTDPEILRQTAQVPWYASLHDGRYKYIRTFVEGEMEELYDLEADPEELTNLALEKARHADVVRMREEAILELKRTGAKMVNSLPAVRND